jgi:hypothetical protein
MSEAIVAQPELSAATLEAVVVGGDLSRLTPAQRLEYYSARCRAAGLDPAAQPFQYINLNGKLTLYAGKGCTDQLSQVHKIKVSIVSQSTESGLRVVHVRAETGDGRATDEIGAVNIENFKGEALANAMMKAVTKAKRRAILSMCGLGMLDETEAETIPNARTMTAEQLHAAAVADPVWDPKPKAPDGQAGLLLAADLQTAKQPRIIRGIPITIPETWEWVKAMPIKGKGPYAKLTWAEVDTQPDPSPFTEWLEKGINEIVVDRNKHLAEGKKNIPLPAAQRALIAFQRLLDRRGGVVEDDEAICPLTPEEMDAADREAGLLEERS